LVALNTQDGLIFNLQNLHLVFLSLRFQLDEMLAPSGWITLPGNDPVEDPVDDYLCELDVRTYIRRLAKAIPTSAHVYVAFRLCQQADACWKITHVDGGSSKVRRLSDKAAWKVLQDSPFHEKLCCEHSIR